MKTLELRRHSIRGTGKGLTPYGVRLARQARKTLEPSYELVVTGPKRRCWETAQALGFDHFLLDTRLDPMDLTGFEPFEKQIKKARKDKPGTAWIEAAMGIPDCRPLLKDAAKAFLKQAVSFLAFVPEGGRALAVTHGGLLEAVALIEMPSYRFYRLGRPFGHCEGFELSLEDGRWSNLKLFRLGVEPEAAEAAAEPETEPEAAMPEEPSPEPEASAVETGTEAPTGA